jgi:DNA-binding CsgD family transcriptional regulator
MLVAGRGMLLLARADAVPARELLLGAAAAAEAWGSENPNVVPWRALAARALVQTGEFDEAMRLAERELTAARCVGTPGATGRALLALAMAAPPERAPALAGEAIVELERSADRISLAEALLLSGVLLRRDQHPAAAREPLRRAMALADDCGADGLEGAIRDELIAAGGRPRRAALSGADALTASERRVAALAAEGMGNREIAQALFLTIKTVETHLTRAYRKLGVRRREELPPALIGA